MTGVRRAVKGVLYGGVLAALVVGITGVVVNGVEPEAIPETFAAVDVQVTDVEATDEVAAEPSGEPSPVNTASSDIPLLNVDLVAEDIVQLAPASRGDARAALQDGDGVTFRLVVDGVTSDLTSSADTLADALTEAGVVLGWEDEVSGDLSAEPVAGAEVLVGRSTTSYVTEQVITPHESEERRTSALLVGQTRVVQRGVDGDERITSQLRLVDGVEVERATIVRTELNAAVTEIIEVGTRQPVVVAPPVTTTPAGSTPSVPTGSVNADTSGNRALGKELMLAYGFAEDQWSCLEALWTKESNWNHLASNRSSGAYGIPQSLPGSKMGSVGSDWQSNPATQIQWGLGYIAGRYSTPCGAWGAFQAKGWY